MTAERPLTPWRLDVPLRGYQADLLARVIPDDGACRSLPGNALLQKSPPYLFFISKKYSILWGRASRFRTQAPVRFP